jgi:hypothetical protein
MALEIKQQKGGNSASGSVGVTLDSSVTAGSALIALSYSFLDTDYTIASNVDGAFTLDTTRYQPVSYVTTIWSRLNCSSGSHTITLSGGDTNSMLHVWEIAGVATTSALDQVQASNPSAASLLVTLTATATTTQADEIVIACAHATAAGLTFAPEAGYTGISTTDSTYNRNFASQAKIVSATAAYGPSWTLNSNLAVDGIVATYKMAAAGGRGGLVLHSRALTGLTRRGLVN